MNDFEAWVGQCLVKAEENGEEQNIECFVAVWAQSREDFEDTLRQYFTNQSQHLLWAEDIFPIIGWLRKHGHNNTMIELSKAVDSHHTVKLGAFTKTASTATAESPPSSSYLTITEHDTPLLDQSHVPQDYQVWIAPELRELLFGQPEADKTLRTYFIVDPTLRKNITGVFDLDSPLIDVPIRCLFKGEKAIELKTVAPYLLDMSLTSAAGNGDNIPSFHKDFFAKHWGQNTGTFIRTTASFEQVWNHYRHFTLVNREGHKNRVFVSFWTEQYVRLYFPYIADNKERVAMWFLRDELVIHSMLADKKGGLALHKAELKASLFDQSTIPKKPFIITEYDLTPFYKDREQKDLDKLVDALKDGFPNELETYTTEAIKDIITEPLERMRSLYGFSSKGHIYLLALWIIFAGPHFEQQDPTGELLSICQSDMEPNQKMKALEQRISQFPIQKDVTK